MNFCSKCGHQMQGNFCSNCGNSSAANVTKSKGNGKAVASMVLGIIALVWALLESLSLASIGEAIQEVVSDSSSQAAAIVGFIIGFNFLSLPCGIVGLILGIGNKNDGKAKAGIITSSLALLVCVISVICIIAAL